MISKLKKVFMIAVFGLIAASTFSLQITAMDYDNEQPQQLQWTDEKFYARDENENTILHKAVDDENEQLVIQILADPRANHNFINAYDVWQQTALVTAADKQNKNLCRLLIEAGASKSILDFRKRTPLSYIDDSTIRAELQALQTDGHNEIFDQDNIERLHKNYHHNQFNGNDTFEMLPSSRKSEMQLWKKLLIGASIVAGIGIIRYVIQTILFDKNEQEEKEG